MSHAQQTADVETAAPRLAEAISLSSKLASHDDAQATLVHLFAGSDLIVILIYENQHFWHFYPLVQDLWVGW